MPIRSKTTQIEHPLRIADGPIRMKLNDADKEAIVAILAIFTDEQFLTNPAAQTL